MRLQRTAAPSQTAVSRRPGTARDALRTAAGTTEALQDEAATTVANTAAAAAATAARTTATATAATKAAAEVERESARYTNTYTEHRARRDRRLGVYLAPEQLQKSLLDKYFQGGSRTLVGLAENQ